jgi:hypothetical protein
MPLTAYAKNIAIDAIARGTNPAAYAQYVGLHSADATKSCTAVASTGIFTSTAHGYSANDCVILSALTGGSGFVAGRLYFVSATNLATNTFSLTPVVGGSIVTGGTDISAGTVGRIVEISGGSYARVATAFAASVNGGDDDSTSHVINVPGGVTVSYVSYWSASSAGNLMSAGSVTPEAFAGAGTYTVTDAKIDLNALA